MTTADGASSQPAEIATLVLAGGDGRRIGGAKSQRLLNGRRLLDFALDAARRTGGPVAVGVRSRTRGDNLGGAEIVLDSPEIEGPLASLTAGLRWACSHEACFLLTLPCDAPFLPVDLAGRLRARIDSSASAIPSSGGQLHPACGLWRVSALDQLAAYLKTGRRSLVGFAEWGGYAAEPWEGAPRDPFFNVNTPEDLARAEAWLSQPHLE